MRPRPPTLTVVGVSRGDATTPPVSPAFSGGEDDGAAQKLVDQKAARAKVPSDGYRWRKYGRKMVNGQGMCLSGAGVACGRYG